MKSSELYKKVLKAGWYEIRQSGSHKTLAHDNYDYQITFPYHGSKEVAKGLASSLMKQAGIK